MGRLRSLLQIPHTHSGEISVRKALNLSHLLPFSSLKLLLCWVVDAANFLPCKPVYMSYWDLYGFVHDTWPNVALHQPNRGLARNPWKKNGATMPSTGTETWVAQAGGPRLSWTSHLLRWPEIGRKACGHNSLTCLIFTFPSKTPRKCYVDLVGPITIFHKCRTRLLPRLGNFCSLHALPSRKYGWTPGWNPCS